MFRSGAGIRRVSSHSATDAFVIAMGNTLLLDVANYRPRQSGLSSTILAY